MEVESALQFSVASVVEDVLQQHGIRLRGIDLESRKAEEAASRRNEAAGWLRKMIGVVAARDLPAEPSEEEFRLGLRSGLILCNVLNKVQAGAVPKVVETPSDASLIPDGAALSAFQYFENVKNFLDAAQVLGLPTFEVSDLEEGGKSVRIVNSVLALKSFYEWKQNGGNGVWKFGGNVKIITSAKSFVRKNSEPFTNSLSRTSSANEKSMFAQEIDNSKMSSSGSLGMLVRAVLLDKKPEEVPMLVESVLTKVMEEFEHRITSQNEVRKSTQKDVAISQGKKTHIRSFSRDIKVEDKNAFSVKKDVHETYISDEKLKAQSLKQQLIVEKQQIDISDLKETLHMTKAGMQFMQKKLHEEFHNLGVHIHGLAHAASGYHKVLEENRKLYNQVQDLKGSIRVYCRVRPFLSGQGNHSSTVDNIEAGEITINTPSKYGKGCRSFCFNKIFGPSASQAEVFADTQPLIRSVVDGYNVCIFAYGQTGSGKTFTMTGPKDLTGQSQGVNFRALHDLFLLAEQRKDIFRYDISVQMIEIYNEQVRDLLVTDGSNKRLEIRNSAQTGLNVPEANIVPVSSTSDVIYLMNLGHKNRAVGATALNDRSSRSHSCLTVHVQGRDLTSGNTLRGCMHLVDLAGSERVDKSEVTGDRLKEAQHINKSLSALGDVIASLAQKNPHVPYRNSKLTQLLQDSLGGQAKTLMFVHVSPELDAVGETLSTLKFAERVATVELGAARVNKDSADVKELKEQIASLKAALARKKGEPEQIQLSNCSDRSRMKITEIPTFLPNQQGSDSLAPNRNACRQPMGDVGNIEVSDSGHPDSRCKTISTLPCKNNSAFRQKKPSFDLEDPLVSSPPWPPMIITDEDREVGSGGWEDKVMVNKQDAANKAGNPLECWEAGNNLIFPKYLQDPSKVYSDQSYNIFPGKNLFEYANNQDLDEDAGTSDSSEPDLLWQFNHSRLPGITNSCSIASKIKKPSPKMTNNVHSTVGGGPSPSHKLSNGIVSAPNRGRRPAIQNDARRKTGNRK